MLVCVTGITGVGKTTILNLLANKYPVKILDTMVHNLYLKNQPGYALIQQHFGNTYVDDFAVNRKKLGQLVFNNKTALNQLNTIMQNEITKLIVNMQNDYCNQIALVEAGALLNNYEKYHHLFDKLLLITAPEHRIRQYNQIKFSHINNDIYNYLKVDVKQLNFDLIVFNNQTPEIAALQIENYLQQLNK